MFTGIIQSIGTLRSIDPVRGVTRLRVDTGEWVLEDVALGDSICVSGVCLTVVACEDAALAFEVSPETLSRTTLGERVAGDRLNLEKALRVGDHMGGHFVSGHVDGVGEIRSLLCEQGVAQVDIGAPKALQRFIAEKGSVCVDGVSLTVNAVDADGFSITLIPHTLGTTTFDGAAVGQRVNLELDLIARYVARLSDCGTMDQ